MAHMLEESSACDDAGCPFLSLFHVVIFLCVLVSLSAEP